uniref:Uncharacterized protein n=1 Tax=Oryza sativa subsp. japonica TaxID=39947 RepID=Q10G74_ORYSJ|nr:hypothetical protein LOC_Os03g43944 [Oryza sativa Japonica Group]
MAMCSATQRNAGLSTSGGCHEKHHASQALPLEEAEWMEWLRIE